MPWNSGVYTRGYPSWTNDANSNLPISATKFDTEDNDFAAGLNNCLTIDGLNKPNAALNWSQAMSLSKAADGTIFSVIRTGGSNNPAMQLQVTDSTSTVTINNSIAGVLALAISGVVGLKLASGGNVTVPAPSSGNAFQATAVAGSTAIVATGSASSGNSYGLLIQAGTTSADAGVRVYDATATHLYFIVGGSGLVQAVDDGGTMQNVGWRGAPTNVQAGYYTLTLSDRGKCVQMSVGNTLTVPSGIFSDGDVVAIRTNVGSGSVTIAQGSGVTLYWGNGGGSGNTGNRSLAAVGVAVLDFNGSGSAVITGSSLT
jgi:hypothetical protein